jgi:hypothetical protein
MLYRNLQHTPGPWTIEEYGDDETPTLVIHKDSESRVCFMATPGSHGDPAKIEANARLIVAAPDMLAALRNVNKLISEAAMTGFNCKDGDWADKLFFSQQMTSDAIAKAIVKTV